MRQNKSFCPFARPETLIYTNLGMGETIDEGLRQVGLEKMMSPEEIVASYHGQGKRRMGACRYLRTLAAKSFLLNGLLRTSAFYYTMVTAFFLYEVFKEDVCAPGIEVSSYATRVRRKIH